jgi:multidrug efflux pump
VSLLALPMVPRQFFPASDRPELVVDLTLPQNVSIFASDRAAAKLDAVLKGNPDVSSWSTYVGRGAIRFYLPLNVQLNNDFFLRKPWSSPKMSPRAKGCRRRLKKR